MLLKTYFTCKSLTHFHLGLVGDHGGSIVDFSNYLGSISAGEGIRCEANQRLEQTAEITVAQQMAR